MFIPPNFLRFMVRNPLENALEGFINYNSSISACCVAPARLRASQKEENILSQNHFPRSGDSEQDIAL